MTILESLRSYQQLQSPSGVIANAAGGFAITPVMHPTSAARLQPYIRMAWGGHDQHRDRIQATGRHVCRASGQAYGAVPDGGHAPATHGHLATPGIVPIDTGRLRSSLQPGSGTTGIDTANPPLWFKVGTNVVHVPRR